MPGVREAVRGGVRYDFGMTLRGSVIERLLRNSPTDLSTELCQHVLSLDFSPEDRKRCDELSEKAAAGTLSGDEQAELDDLLIANDVLALLQSNARRVLSRRASTAA